MLRQKTGEWHTLTVDIEGWRDKQNDKLKQLALQTAEKVKQTGLPQPLYNLTASQRRIIHLELSTQEGIQTESQGEGKERYLLVSPKA